MKIKTIFNEKYNYLLEELVNTTAEFKMVYDEFVSFIPLKLKD